MTWIRALRDRDAAIINLQVVNEFIAVSLRKLGSADTRLVMAAADDLLRWGDVAIERHTVGRAWMLRHRTGYQWFDCLLLASALDAGCTLFLSEDMQHGHDVGGITIIDPFKSDRAVVLANLDRLP
jgi:predicted nucleic acid-binding protein